MILFPVGPKCWHGWDQKWWRYLHCKCHFGTNNWCDKNVPCLVLDRLIQGLHCSYLTPPVMVQTACRKNMTSASIQQMLHLGCIIQWFSILNLPFKSSEVSQKQRRSKHNWAGVGGVHCSYCSWAAAQGDPLYHLCKVTGKQISSVSIIDDYGIEFPQTLIS